MEGFGPEKLILIFAITMLFFGGKKLPELASGMGRGIRDFKRALSGEDEAQPAQVPAAQQAAALPAQAAEPKRLG